MFTSINTGTVSRATLGKLNRFQFPNTAQVGIAALVKVHTCPAPSFRIHIRCLQRIPEERKHFGRSGRCGRCVQQNAIQTDAETSCTIWCQFDTHMMACSSTPGEQGRHATWKLDLLAPTTDTAVGHPHGSPLPPVLYNVFTKGLADLKQKWLKPGAYTCKHRAYLQNSR